MMCGEPMPYTPGDGIARRSNAGCIEA